MPGRPTLLPTKLLVKIKDPLFRSSIAGTWALAARKAAVRLDAITESQLDVVKSARAPSSPTIQALLNPMSRAPNVSKAAFTHASCVCSSQISPATIVQRPPSA